MGKLKPHSHKPEKFRCCSSIQNDHFEASEYFITKITRREAQGSTRGAHCERVHEGGERLLEVGVVVLQHTTAATARQIALSDLFVVVREQAPYQRCLAVAGGSAHVDSAKCYVVCA